MNAGGDCEDVDEGSWLPIDGYLEATTDIKETGGTGTEEMVLRKSRRLTESLELIGDEDGGVMEDGELEGEGGPEAMMERMSEDGERGTGDGGRGVTAGGTGETDGNGVGGLVEKSGT